MQKKKQNHCKTLLFFNSDFRFLSKLKKFSENVCVSFSLSSFEHFCLKPRPRPTCFRHCLMTVAKKCSLKFLCFFVSYNMLMICSCSSYVFLFCLSFCQYYYKLCRICEVLWSFVKYGKVVSKLCIVVSSLYTFQNVYKFVQRCTDV